MRPLEDNKEELKEGEEGQSIEGLGKRKSREFDKKLSIEEAVKDSKEAIEESRKRLKRFEEETGNLRKIISMRRELV